MENKRVPLTVGGKQVGWAYPLEDGTLSIEITDQETLLWLSAGTTEGLSIEVQE